MHDLKGKMLLDQLIFFLLLATVVLFCMAVVAFITGGPAGTKYLVWAGLLFVINLFVSWLGVRLYPQEAEQT